MRRHEVFEQVVEVLRRTFKSPNLDVHDRTTAADIDGWDSLAHATLLVRLEKHFNVRIPDAAAYESANVGELVDRIAAVLKD